MWKCTVRVSNYLYRRNLCSSSPSIVNKFVANLFSGCHIVTRRLADSDNKIPTCSVTGAMPSAAVHVANNSQVKTALYVATRCPCH